MRGLPSIFLITGVFMLGIVHLDRLSNTWYEDGNGTATRGLINTRTIKISEFEEIGYGEDLYGKYKLLKDSSYIEPRVYKIYEKEEK